MAQELVGLHRKRFKLPTIVLFTGVILAAGEGRRAGGYKPLMPLGAGVVVDRVIAAAKAVADEIRVVGGSNFEQLEEHVVARWPGVTLVRNTEWERGMFSSVQKGLAGVVNAAFVHPADIPGPGEGVYRALAEASALKPGTVLRPAYGGRSGHPVLLLPAAVRAVQEADPVSNLRKVLAPLPCFDVEVDDEFVLRDFDTIAEFANLRARLEGALGGRGG
jgi:molybdenum cofactor cytidylyltransferase